MIKLDNGSEIVPIFATPLYFSSSDCVYDFSEEEIKFVKDLEYKKNNFNLISVTNRLFDCSEMNNLKEFITTQVENYKKFLTIPEHVKFRITDSWSNKTYIGGKHHPHHHPNSVISGVISVSKDNQLTFDCDSPGVDRLFPGWSFVRGVTHPLVSNQFTINFGGSGRLVLFPSKLTHNVPTVTQDIERISISFNLFPYGEISSSHASSLTL